MNNIILSFCSLSKNYYFNGVSQLIVDKMSFSFFINSIYLLTGPSGSGKSTLLNMLSLIDSNYQGTISYKGSVITKNDSWWYVKKRCFMKQENELIPHLLLIKQLKIKAFLQSVSNEKLNEIIDNYGNLLLINHLLNKFPEELSGGEKKRIYLLLSLINNADIYLIDEPSVHLEIKFIPIIESIFKN